MSELNIRDKIHIYLLKNGANKKTIKDLYELDGLIKYSSKKVREWNISDIKEPTEEQLNQFTPEDIALIKKQKKNIDDEKDLILSKFPSDFKNSSYNLSESINGFSISLKNPSSSRIFIKFLQ